MARQVNKPWREMTKSWSSELELGVGRREAQVFRSCEAGSKERGYTENGSMDNGNHWAGCGMKSRFGGCQRTRDTKEASIHDRIID
jgi:hypothetical protein